MDLLQFHRMRTAVQDNAYPAKEGDLAPVEQSLRDLLMASGVFEEVEVEHTDDPNQLVIALCKFLPYFTERDVARHLERIWADRVSYPFWEAHGIHVEDESRRVRGRVAAERRRPLRHRPPGRPEGPHPRAAQRLAVRAGRSSQAAARTCPTRLAG